VVMNLVIQVLAMKLSRKIGFKSYSEEFSRSCYFIFSGQIVNFAFI